MRMRSEALRNWAALRRACAIAAAALALACATSGPKRPEQVEVQDASGFTLTEEVRVSGAVRADFERALELLEQEQDEQGIALLREVTEAAPNLTSAHIDLGIAYARS